MRHRHLLRRSSDTSSQLRPDLVIAGLGAIGIQLDRDITGTRVIGPGDPM